MTVRASAMSRAAVDGLVARPMVSELEARVTVQMLQVGGWPVKLRDHPAEVEPGSGVWVVATVLDHDTDEAIADVRFLATRGRS
ncbi:MAG TPA: hypothetical protein VGW74_11525 [Propionibacteriaceae bacterium]|nr:hypothetical protein [Propionibacteriaceae bacterium]